MRRISQIALIFVTATLSAMSLAAGPGLLPEGLVEIPCHDALGVLGSPAHAGVAQSQWHSREFLATSDAAITQTMGHLMQIPGIREDEGLKRIADLSRTLIGNPSQWIDFTTTHDPKAGISTQFESEVKQAGNRAKFRPIEVEWSTGVQWGQKIKSNSARDILLGTLRWPQTKFIDETDATWRMRVRFTNTQFGKFQLRLYFEERVQDGTN